MNLLIHIIHTGSALALGQYKTIMLSNDNTRLTILSNGINIDKNLLKWSVVLDNTENIVEKVSLETIIDSPIRDVNINVSGSLLDSLHDTPMTGRSFINFTSDNGSISGTSADATNERVSPIKRLFRRFKTQKTEPVVEVAQLDVMEFFNQVKLATEESRNSYMNRIDGYLTALKSAEATGQTALQETLKSNLIINKYESVLYANEQYYAIDEDTAVEFVKQVDKGVRLDYVRNFTRPIPQDVIDKKTAADAMEVFDNYVVMHYDPEMKSFKMTEAERLAELERQKDPILFGVISGSNKLYYVADWIDEECNLTLNEFVDVMQMSKSEIQLDSKI